MAEQTAWKDEWQNLAIQQRVVMEDLLLDLFPSDFMGTHTPYRHLKEFFHRGPWRFHGLEDVRTIPLKELNHYVRQNTDFPDWEIMWRTALSEWTGREESN